MRWVVAIVTPEDFFGVMTLITEGRLLDGGLLGTPSGVWACRVDLLVEWMCRLSLHRPGFRNRNVPKSMVCVITNKRACVPRCSTRMLMKMADRLVGWVVRCGCLCDSIVASIATCHVEDPGSIPGRGASLWGGGGRVV